MSPKTRFMCPKKPKDHVETSMFLKEHRECLEVGPKRACNMTPTFHLRLLDGFPSATLPLAAIDLPNAAPPPLRRGDTPFPPPSPGLNLPPPLGLALGSASG